MLLSQTGQPDFAARKMSNLVDDFESHLCFVVEFLLVDISVVMIDFGHTIFTKTCSVFYIMIFGSFNGCFKIILSIWSLAFQLSNNLCFDMMNIRDITSLTQIYIFCLFLGKKEGINGYTLFLIGVTKVGSQSHTILC